MQRFNRMFAERYKDQVLHLTHAPVKSIDPFNKTLSTEFDQLKFDDAIIIPPQQAADLVRQAGLVEADAFEVDAHEHRAGEDAGDEEE